MKHEILITLALAVIVTILGVGLYKTFRRAFLVPEGGAGLLYHNGRFVELLVPGRHIRWGRFWTVTAADTRKTFLLVAAQEVLTADNIGIKVSLAVTYQVLDPIKAALESQDWQSDIYNAAQVALRAVVATVSVNALLNQRMEIAAQLLVRVQRDAAKVGVDVHAVEVQEVMFPAEIKRGFAEVLKARQEGQPALEGARGGTAATRSLANAARIMEGGGGTHTS